MKTICIDRKSVCMGDDAQDHRMELKVSDDCSYSGLIKAIGDVGFLPLYDTMWLIISNRRGFVAAYYNSSYSKEQPHIIWQRDFDETEDIGDDDSFFFDCHLFKREMYRYSQDYDKAVETIRNQYHIDEELLQQIEMYLSKIRGNNNEC